LLGRERVLLKIDVRVERVALAQGEAVMSSAYRPMRALEVG